MDRSKDANPIIVIPGVAGTRLVDVSNEKTAWGSFGFDSYWPATEKDNKLLALPLIDNLASVEERANKVKPTSVLKTFSINLQPFYTFELAIYGTIVKSLQMAGYELIQNNDLITQDKSNASTPMFEFAYDWRKPNADSAIQLSEFIKAKSKKLELKKPYKKDQRFDIICHSMGCLVARYYLRYGGQGLGTSETPPELDWSGGENIENIIMVAPPNKGSIDAFSDLLNGRQVGPINWIKYPSAVLGTMPSLYELLPREDISQAVDHKGEAIDLMDPQLWQSMNWGILNQNQKDVLAQIAPEDSTGEERYSLAKGLQESLLNKARLFHSRLDKISTPPDTLKFYLFAGTGEMTESKVRVNRMTKSVTIETAKSGDGKVLRASAFAIKDAMMPYDGSIIEWENAIFFFTNHLNLFKSNDFFVNLYDILMWREVL